MRARYSRQQGYVISSSRPTRKNRTTVRTVQRKLTFGPTTAKFFGLGVLVILAVIMLARSSASSSGAYAQAELNKEIGTTQREVEQMKLEAKRAQSIQEIQNSSVAGQMQPMENAQYVEKGQVAGAATEAP